MLLRVRVGAEFNSHILKPTLLVICIHYSVSPHTTKTVSQPNNINLAISIGVLKPNIVLSLLMLGMLAF